MGRDVRTQMVYLRPSRTQLRALHVCESVLRCAVPAEAWYFLAGTTVLLLLVILAILYLEKFACFKICDGATCFDVASTDAGALLFFCLLLAYCARALIDHWVEHLLLQYSTLKDSNTFRINLLEITKSQLNSSKAATVTHPDRLTVRFQLIHKNFLLLLYCIIILVFQKQATKTLKMTISRSQLK